MTQQQFLDKYRHELAGLILDGATAQRTGADLGMFARTICKTVDAKLAQMYQDLRPDPKPAPNGAIVRTTK